MCQAYVKGFILINSISSDNNPTKELLLLLLLFHIIVEKTKIQRNYKTFPKLCSF